MSETFGAMAAKPVAVALLASLFVAPAAQAQDGLSMNIMPSFANTLVNTTVRDSMLGVDSFRPHARSAPRSLRPNAGMAMASGGPRGAPIPGATTRFIADRAVSERVRRQFLDFVQSKSGGAGSRALVSAFSTTDPTQSWARQAAPDGMRLGDVADALAEYWVTNWLIARGEMNAPPGKVRAVRDQVRATLLSNPGFARLNDAQRQQMAETLIYSTLVQGEVFGDAMKRRDASLIGRAGDAAVARFRNEMGVNLRALTLTDQGFVRRG